jgi:hypothetical protein
MPPSRYTAPQDAARLSADGRAQLIAGIKASNK